MVLESIVVLGIRLYNDPTPEPLSIDHVNKSVLSFFCPKKPIGIGIVY